MTPTAQAASYESFKLAGSCLDTSPQQSPSTQRRHVKTTPITPVQETIQGAAGPAELVIGVSKLNPPG